jgi:hypothetical protein
VVGDQAVDLLKVRQDKEMVCKGKRARKYVFCTAS